MKKVVYIVKSGTLNNHTNQYWLTDEYFTSEQGAMNWINSIRACNRAVVIDANPIALSDNDILAFDYVGEERYKARIILTKAELRTY